MSELVKPEYINEAYLIKPPHYNYRIDTGLGRYYMRCYDDGTTIHAPSFTVIKRYAGATGYGLEKWFKNNTEEYVEWYLEHSADYGSWFHIMAGYFLRGFVCPFDRNLIMKYMELVFNQPNHMWDFEGCKGWMKKTKRNPLKDLYGFIKWAQDYKVEPIALEYPVMHPGGAWAGTIDLICKITSLKTRETIIAMVDFKTGYNFYEDHAIQLYAYSLLWNQEWPEFQVQRVFNFGCKDFKLSSLKRANFVPYNFKDQTDNPTNSKWQHWVYMYHQDPKNKLSLKKLDFKTGQIGLETNLEELVETIDYARGPVSASSEDEQEINNE